MEPVTSFLIGVGIILSAATGIVLYLRPHLLRILGDLCGSEERAGFWAAFASIVLVLVPAVCALSSPPNRASAAASLFDFSDQLQGGLIGLVAAVILLGFILARFIPPRVGQR